MVQTSLLELSSYLVDVQAWLLICSPWGQVVMLLLQRNHATNTVVALLVRAEA